MKFVKEAMSGLGYISPEDFSFFKHCHTVDEAINEIVQFYKAYHSVRWVGDTFVIRITRALRPEAVQALNEKFGDMLREGAIVQGGPLPPEKNEPEIWELPRLVLKPHRRDFGRYRELIDEINRLAE